MRPQIELDLAKCRTMARLRYSVQKYTSHCALPLASIWSLLGAADGRSRDRMLTGRLPGRTENGAEGIFTACDHVLRGWPDEIPAGWPSKRQQ